MCPPIDDLPPPPSAAKSSIDDLPPPPPTDKPADAPAPEEPGLLDKLSALKKAYTSDLSLPKSLSDIGSRVSQGGLFRTAKPEVAPGDAEPDGKMTEQAMAKGAARSAAGAPPFPFFSGGGLVSAAKRVGANTVLGSAEAGLHTPGELFDADKAKDGLALSGVLSLLGEGAGALAGKAAPAVEDSANSRSASAMGWTKAMRRRVGNDAALDAGRVGLDEGVVTPFATTSDKLARMGEVGKAAGQTINGTMDTLDKAGIREFSPGDTAMQIESQLGDKANMYRQGRLNNGLGKQYDNLINDVLDQGPDKLRFADAQKLKQYVGDAAYPGGFPTEGTKQLQQGYGIVNKSLDDAVDRGAQQIGDSDMLQNLQQARKNSKASFDTTAALEGQQAGEAGNQQIGLKSTVLAAGQLAAGNPLKAAAAIGLNEGAKRFGNNFAAVGADALSKILKDSPEVLGRYAPVLVNALQRGGPDALTAAHHTLLKTDPNYAKQLNGDGAP